MERPLDDRGRVCAVGALRAAVGVHPLQPTGVILYRVAFDALTERTRYYSHVTRWSDQHTQSQVIHVLRELASAHEGKLIVATEHTITVLGVFRKLTLYRFGDKLWAHSVEMGIFDTTSLEDALSKLRGSSTTTRGRRNVSDGCR